ncbi:unnamed protein product [Trifolium pratense]|uniref:Uncharacterized protein n=1 Tax=Trifolium pratense TaxID=57577 RepID=A0ACB0L722_TRIPR|nr:unnamed protein product [Trifolium pratense]
MDLISILLNPRGSFQLPDHIVGCFERILPRKYCSLGYLRCFLYQTNTLFLCNARVLAFSHDFPMHDTH